MTRLSAWPETALRQPLSAAPGVRWACTHSSGQAELDDQAAALRASAGTGSVIDNLTTALTTIFSPVPVAILSQATAAVSAYLADERQRGRLCPDIDTDTLTLSLVGGGHLLFADRDSDPRTRAAVHKLVNGVLADVVIER